MSVTRNSPRLRWHVRLLQLGAAMAVLIAANVEAAGVGYVYAYFKGGWPTGGSSGVFMSFSTDGLNFTPLNNGNAVLTPPQPPDFPAGENQMRDPSVVQGPDGLFHMVWTSGITAKTIGYSSSPDLVTWSTPKRVQVWPPEVTVANTWAPETFYDGDAEKYLVVWASNLDNGHHKLYSFTTTDFEAISPPQLFYYNGNTVIDGVIAEDAANDRFVMAMKDERNSAKNIWLATSENAQGPYTRGDAPILGPGSGVDNNQVEGPSLLKVGDLWVLHYDAYTAGYLGVATSPDLATWTNRTAQSTLPTGGNPHHGTVFAAPVSAIGWDLPITRSDLNDDGAIDLNDWTIFRAHHLADMSGFTATERAARGDLNGDGSNSFVDFRLFQADFNAWNGSDAFTNMLQAIPEPGSAGMLASGAALLSLCRAARSSTPDDPVSPREVECTDAE
jgi:hypothetical protein